MKIITPHLPQNNRIICVSDIHANLNHFKLLLEKCNYNKDKDCLFILGDIIEKGRDNLSTLRYVMELCKDNKAICTKGNNDTMCVRMTFDDDKDKFLERIRSRPHNTFLEMAESIGVDEFEENFDEKRQKVSDSFKNELDFLKNLPIAIETKYHIFVHAGIERRSDWRNTSERFAITRPWFLRSEHCSNKTVVCGHYPTYNYRRANNTCLPIIDSKKRMICIDGGASTKCAGQLNALIINCSGGKYAYETVFVPLGEERTVKRAVTSDCKPVHVDWESHTLTVIEKQGDLLYVRIDQTGETGLIPENRTGYWNEKLHGWVHLNTFLSAKVGERFYISAETEEYYFGIAENGQVGLLPKSCFE
ncbi:MAG: metallophosphoesterase [Ruminiclostridium sp.]|nr:metallophosphoesterase [Ruminiclostridium sp.]